MSSWENDINVDMVGACKIHHGSYRCQELGAGVFVLQGQECEPHRHLWHVADPQAVSFQAVLCLGNTSNRRSNLSEARLCKLFPANTTTQIDAER